MDREQIDGLWSEHVGSRLMRWGDELRMLNGLRQRGALPNAVIRQLYYTSKYWRMIRRVVLKRDGFRCVACGSARDLHVDHLRYPRSFGEENIDQLRTLCRLCHAAKTSRHDLLATPGSVLRPSLEGELYEVLR